MKFSAYCAAAALVTVAGATPLRAASPCATRALIGSYGLLASGSILVAPGFPDSLLGPFGRAGLLTADGVGNVSLTNTASYNGTILKEVYSGGYTVNADCTIDFTAQVPLPVGPGGSLVPVPFEFIGTMTENGDEVTVLICGVAAPCFAGPTGNVIRVILTRNAGYPAVCSAAVLSGGFQLDMSGNVITGTQKGPFARVGRLDFDGRAAFTAQTLVNYAGSTVQKESLSGSYTVDAACNVVLTFSDGALHTWNGTVTGVGSGADLIVADQTGVVITGTLKQVSLAPRKSRGR